MSEPKSGKIALVTSANNGLGFETARRLAKQGAKVLLGSGNADRGKEAETKLRDEGLEVEFILFDEADEKTRESAARYIEDKFGRLDILVNNAGVMTEGSVELDNQVAGQTPIDIYRKTFETNFFNMITVTQKLLPLVEKSEAGRIVNLSSSLGPSTNYSDPTSFLYDFKIPAYDASKAAVNSFTVHLAYQLKDSPIKVNAAHSSGSNFDMGFDNTHLEIEDNERTSVEMATLERRSRGREILSSRS